MKKIMFNEQYGLETAVLTLLKDLTRRIIQGDFDEVFFYEGDWVGRKGYESVKIMSRYEVGEVVAVAQRYYDIYNGLSQADEILCMKSKGWRNKMFVRADLMPRQIRITNIRVERLQDISDEDCMKEGIKKVFANNNWGNAASHWEYQVVYYDKLGNTRVIRGFTPQECFSYLIDKVSGVCTWERNPWVFVYEFELVK